MQLSIFDDVIETTNEEPGAAVVPVQIEEPEEQEAPATTSVETVPATLDNKIIAMLNDVSRYNYKRRGEVVKGQIIINDISSIKVKDAEKERDILKVKNEKLLKEIQELDDKLRVSTDYVESIEIEDKLEPMIREYNERVDRCKQLCAVVTDNFWDAVNERNARDAWDRDIKKFNKYINEDRYLEIFKLYGNSKKPEFYRDTIDKLLGIDDGFLIGPNTTSDILTYEEFKKYVCENVSSKLIELFKVLEVRFDRFRELGSVLNETNYKDYILKYRGINNKHRKVMEKSIRNTIDKTNEVINLLGLKRVTAGFEVEEIDVEFQEINDSSLDIIGKTTILDKEFNIYHIDGETYIKASKLAEIIGYKKNNFGSMYKLVSTDNKIKKFDKGLWATNIYITYEGVDEVLNRSRRALLKRIEILENEDRLNFDVFIPKLFEAVEAVFKRKSKDNSHYDWGVKRMELVKAVKNADVISEIYNEVYLREKQDFEEEKEDGHIKPGDKEYDMDFDEYRGLPTKEEITSLIDYTITADLYIPYLDIAIKRKGTYTTLDYHRLFDCRLDKWAKETGWDCTFGFDIAHLFEIDEDNQYEIIIEILEVVFKELG